MMVELFCGILSGAHYGSNIRQWMKTERPADLGQGFVAIDPNAFGFGFEDRLSDYMRMMRELPRVSFILSICQIISKAVKIKMLTRSVSLLDKARKQKSRDATIFSLLIVS
ncbi:hypothetical protein AHF37_07511 [Paragonimus kellicotti]|nr:hypothetical protein AHF37_07511 [Paragonimus kellicotti]